MKRNEIKKMVEQVVRVEYVAADGTVFFDEGEAKKYEESALFAVSKKLKRLNKERISHYSLLDSDSDEEELEIFDVQTEEDMTNLKQYLFIKASLNGASESSIKECFESENGKRDKFVFNNATIRHEILVFWNYCNDWFWIYGDGSLNGYFDFIRGKYNELVNRERKDG